MKLSKLIIVMALVISPFVTQAQSQFDKFEDIEGVTSVIVNQKAFSLMSKIGAESDDEYLDLIKNITSLKVFATESASVAKQMEAEVNKYLKNSNLEELMRIKDGDNNVAIYIKEGKSEDYVKELFMFVKESESESNESVIISLTGEIDLKQISKLTEKMNLPGGEHLERANKKN
jgi:HD superfamily phosphohydrolase